METTKELLDNVLQNMEKSILNEDNGDYVKNEDGLVYCGKCNTAKQQMANIGGVLRKIPKNCDCRNKEIEKQRKEMEEFEHGMRINMFKSMAFDDELMYAQTFEREDGSLEYRQAGLNYVKHFEDMEKENIGLILTGAVGTGKTYLAASIANALIEKGVSVRMTNFGVILNDMMNLQIDKNKYIKNLNSNRLLIIDDFGIQRDTSFAMEHIFNIIDSRYRANKPILVTTNLPISYLMNTTDLKEKRIYSRLLEMATPLIFNGENHRIKTMREKAMVANMVLMEGR